MRTIEIEKKEIRIHDRLKTRRYVSIETKDYYHKFFNADSLCKCLDTGKIDYAWGDNVWELLERLE